MKEYTGMNIWKDRDGKVSFNRVVATLFVIAAFAFLGKSWWTWKALPGGMDVTLVLFFSVATGAMKATDFISKKRVGGE